MSLERERRGGDFDQQTRCEVWKIYKVGDRGRQAYTPQGNIGDDLAQEETTPMGRWEGLSLPLILGEGTKVQLNTGLLKEWST